MKNPAQILQQPHYANKIESQFGMTVTDIKEVMEEYHNSQWISVGERLPEYEVQILALLKSGKITIDTLKVSNSYGREINWFSSHNITHWKPLPEKPII